MSTGQRQRVKLAAAFVHDPALLLLDEPTNGLDPVQRDEMLALVRRIGTEFGIDVVVSSHLLEEVERVCDAVVILADGVVAAAGTLDSLRSGEDVVVVEVIGDPAPLVAALRAAGSPLDVAGSRVTVQLPEDPVGIAGAYDLLRDAAVSTGHAPAAAPAAHGLARGGLPRSRQRRAGQPWRRRPATGSDGGGRPVSDARILDRGYRRYDGPRRGARGAVASLTRQSALRALGLRRTFWAKVFPLLSAVIAYLPATVFVGIAALFPDELLDPDAVIPGYADYYGFITAAIVVFVALVGPEVLCPDRRDGMLGLYLASPLTRDTYLLAKALAVVPVLAIVTVGPPLLLLVGPHVRRRRTRDARRLPHILARMWSAAWPSRGLHGDLPRRRQPHRPPGRGLGGRHPPPAGDQRGHDRAGRAGRAASGCCCSTCSSSPSSSCSGSTGELGAEPTLATSELVAANVAWTLGAGLLVRERYRRLQVTR
jgi:hypothetical protein